MITLYHRYASLKIENKNPQTRASGRHTGFTVRTCLERMGPREDAEGAGAAHGRLAGGRGGRGQGNEETCGSHGAGPRPLHGPRTGRPGRECSPRCISEHLIPILPSDQRAMVMPGKG